MKIIVTEFYIDNDIIYQKNPLEFNSQNELINYINFFSQTKKHIPQVKRDPPNP